MSEKIKQQLSLREKFEANLSLFIHAHLSTTTKNDARVVRDTVTQDKKARNPKQTLEYFAKLGNYEINPLGITEKSPYIFRVDGREEFSMEPDGTKVPYYPEGREVFRTTKIDDGLELKHSDFQTSTPMITSLQYVLWGKIRLGRHITLTLNQAETIKYQVNPLLGKLGLKISWLSERLESKNT